jgi:hypothetical protein
MELKIEKTWTPIIWLTEADKEFRNYKKTDKGEKLAEAGEKLYNSLVSLLEERTGKKLNNYHKIKEAATKDPFAKKIFDDAYWLHIFFHRRFTEDITTEEEKFANVMNKMEKEIA